MFSSHIPNKYKATSCPTISIVIRDHTIHRGLLDLRASVNLLSFTVHKRLGLGELRATRIVLQIADMSTRLSWGVVEDVLIKV